MNNDYSVLRSTDTSSPLTFENGQLTSTNGATYPVIRGIPRFVVGGNYSDGFGTQWNAFRKTQLDSYTKTNITRQRLSRCMNGHLEKISGKLILEAGSGAGRFTEILLEEGASVHSFDFSNAVEANAENNGSSDRLTLVQADIRKMPFENNCYDYVICLGVLQHTPNPEESMRYLFDKVRSGGYLIVDHYSWKLRDCFPPPIGGAQPIYRRILLALPKQSRMRAVKRIVDFWFPLHWRFRDSLLAQRILRRMTPVHFYYQHLRLRNKQEYYEWALMDTHDGTTDFYKHLRTVNQIRKHLKSIGATDIVVLKGGNGVEGMCRKPERRSDSINSR